MIRYRNVSSQSPLVSQRTSPEKSPGPPSAIATTGTGTCAPARTQLLSPITHLRSGVIITTVRYVRILNYVYLLNECNRRKPW